MGPGGTFAALRERPFRLLWLGRVSSSTGDVLVPVALAFAVLGVRDSSLSYGVVLATFALSRVVFSLVGGVVADRFSRRTVMISCDIVRGTIEVVTATLIFMHAMTLPLFVVTAALFGAASAFFGPAAIALVPATVAPGDLQQANALLGMSQSVINVFGPALSGILIATTHTTAWVFTIDAVTFAASALFLLRLRLADVTPHPARESFVSELKAGYHEVRSRRWVSSALVAFSISNMCIASFLVLGPVIIRHHGGAGGWGAIAACGAFGLFAGGYLSSRTRPSHPVAVAFTSSALIALPIAALAHPLPTPVIAIAFAIGIGSTEYADTLWETTLQRRIPGPVLARVRSYDQLVSFAFMPIGYLACGAIAAAAGTEPTLLVTAAVAAIANLGIASLPSIRKLSADDPALTPAPV